jgi:LacI family transcriptional regulator
MEGRTKHTMRDVARLAGVSIATVSAVINSSANVSSERKVRVEAAMAALDYHPDEVARSLKTGRTNVIGVVIPDITNAFYPEVVRGIEEAARETGYSVLLCDSSEDAAEERNHLSSLFSRRVDGVLLACCCRSAISSSNLRLSSTLARAFISRSFTRWETSARLSKSATPLRIGRHFNSSEGPPCLAR